MPARLLVLSLWILSIPGSAHALTLGFDMTFTSEDGGSTLLGSGSASGTGSFDVGTGEIVLGPMAWTWTPATSGVGLAFTFDDWTHTITGSVAGTTLTVSPATTSATFDVASCPGGGVCFFFLSLTEAFFTAVDPDLVFTTLAPGGTGSQEYTGVLGGILHVVAVDFTILPEPRGLLAMALVAPWLAVRGRRLRRR